MVHKRPSVACIDDSQTNLVTLKEALDPHFEVTTYQQPMRLLKDRLSFDCYLVDFHMPAMSGMELVDKIMRSPEYGQEPILIISQDTSVNTRITSFEKGAVSYLDRFVDDSELIAAINSKLNYYFLNRPILEVGNLVINKDNLTAKLNTTFLDLDMTEYRFMKAICEAHALLISRNDLIQAIKGDPTPTRAGLEKKLGDWDYEITEDPNSFKLQKKH